MPGDYSWNCVESLSATFDGGHKVAEDNLSLYEGHALKFPPEKRAELRRQLADIIGGLARLENRLAEQDRAANRPPPNLI
jgi:hypothetical protein